MISITIDGQTKNSSDLEGGRRPKLKSDEFFVWPSIVIEIMRCEVNTFSEKVIHLSVDHSTEARWIATTMVAKD